MTVLRLLSDKGAVTLDKHFVYKSGKHGEGYIDMDWLYGDVALMRVIAAFVVLPFLDEEFDVIVSPAVGGVALVSDVSAYLQTHSKFPTRLWADKDGKEFRFSRAGFAEKLKNKRVLVVEDLVTTGGSVQKVCLEVEKHGGTVVGVAAVCNRGGLKTSEDFPWRIESAASVDFAAYDEAVCPFCIACKPIVTDVGHGGEYQKERPHYIGGWEQILAH